MEEFQSYTPEEIILSNLDEVQRSYALCRERELAHLRELAHEIASELADNAALLEALSEHRPPMLSLQEKEQSEALGFSRLLSTTQRVRLCMELCKRLPSPSTLWQDVFAPTDADPTSSSYQRISYQRNRYTDLAYEQFSRLLSNPKASYSHSFPLVCEDVYNGVSEYCILPIENSAEGRLHSFTRFIEEYGLKITATCNVPAGEDRVTCFALLRKSLTALPTPSSAPLYFEFSSAVGAYPNAADIFSAAACCGLSLHRADVTGSHSDTETTTLLRAVFLVGEGDLSAFLLYLAMELPSASLIGLYRSIPLS